MRNPFIIKEEDPSKKFLGLFQKKSNDRQIKDYAKSKLEGNTLPGSYDDSDFLKPLIETNDINKFVILLAFSLIILFSRVFYLQIIKGDYYRDIAEGNRLRVQPYKSARGIIYDRNEKPLVENTPRFSLTITPADLPKDENYKKEILLKLSQILEKPLIDIESQLKNKSSFYYEPVLIDDNLEYQKALILTVESQYLPGVSLNMENRRKYLAGREFSHLLGYEGKINPQELEEYKDEYLLNDYLGKSGVELFYEKFLKGQNGKKQIEVDSLGKEKRVVSTQPPVSGDNLVLTIDSDLQKELFTALKEAAVKKAAIVALNPKNGQVLALISYPDFDNNDFSQGISRENYQKLMSDEDKPLFSRAISGEYPSGSTIKLMMASAALQEGIVTYDTKVNSTGGLRIGNWFFGDWKAGGHGLTNVTKALADSVNTFFYYVGGGYQNFNGLGMERIYKYAELFGLNNKTGIDLPNESAGFFPTEKWKEEVKEEAWYIGDTYHVSIGQGDVLATPLQIANLTAIVANGGTFYRPYLLKKIIRPDKNEEIIIMPEIIRDNFIDLKNINIVRQGLREGVLYGSSRSLASLPIEAAGKTGTAETTKDKKPHAWFTCFAPYENPEIVITVLVENGGEGSSVALPIAKKALSWYFNQVR